jgi:hypothetical protein
MKSVPSSMFKYFGPERLDVLKGCMVRYSPLGAFNDPFEGRPEILSVTSPQQAKETFQAVIPEAIKEALDSVPPELKALIPLPMLETLMREQMVAKESEILVALQSFTPKISQLMSSTFDKSLGAFCLSEVPDSLLMWSHYGASHAGFVLEFDARHTYFHEQKGPEDEFRHLRRVEYRETRPSASLTDFDGVDVFLVKSGHWAYEREWRIFRALREANLVIPAEPHSFHLFSFPPDALRSLILGARATSDTVAAVKDVLLANSNFKHVRLRRARADDSHFLLRIEDYPA